MKNEKEKTRKQAMNDAKMYMANDWDLAEETPEYILLKRNEATGLGHLVVFCIFGFWTFGIANLIYHLMKNKKKKIVK